MSWVDYIRLTKGNVDYLLDLTLVGAHLFLDKKKPGLKARALNRSSNHQVVVLVIVILLVAAAVVATFVIST